MKRAKYICATFYLFALLAFTGCASLVQVKAEKSGMQTLSAEIDLGEVITNAIKEASSGLSEINSSDGLDSNNELVIFDTKKIKSALENSEFKNAKISSPEFSKLNISGTGNISSFAFQNEKSLKIKFSPENIKNLASTLPTETQSFFDLLMAPVFTGEKMTANEYEDLVAVVYGENLAQELKKSAVELSLVSPAGKTKRFSIPLTDFLTLSEEKIFSIDF